MRRALGLASIYVAACGHAQANATDSIAVAPKPVVAKPLEVVGDGSGGAGDVASFELAVTSTEICARLEGKVWCGRGIDDEAVVNGPPIGGYEDATSIAIATEYGCLTTRRGTVHCWGSNVNGQLGGHVREDRHPDPVQVTGVANAKRVFAGDEHACATTHDGALVCWGLNQSGETGGKTSWAPAARELVTPTVVPGLTDVVSAAMSYRSTCALTAKRDVWCWGTSITNEQQQKQTHQNEEPFRIAGLAKSDDLAAGAGAFCTARTGDVLCIGSTYALLKQPDGEDRDAPAKVDIKGVTKVRIGGQHACALTRDGRIWCWGYNSSGELGRDDPHDADHGYEPKDPKPVAGLPPARDVVVSHATSCAITGPEEAWCWGVWPYGPTSKSGAPRIEPSPVRVRLR